MLYYSIFRAQSTILSELGAEIKYVGFFHYFSLETYLKNVTTMKEFSLDRHNCYFTL